MTKRSSILSGLDHSPGNTATRVPCSKTFAPVSSARLSLVNWFVLAKRTCHSKKDSVNPFTKKKEQRVGA